MAGEQKVDLGLTEFVSKLIDDTFSAVTQTARDQAQRDSEITAAAELDFDSFKARYISPEDVEDELAELFPSDEADHLHAIYTGASYIPAGVQGELPAVFSVLGLKLGDKDIKSLDGLFSLTEQGVNHIKSAAQKSIAEESYKAFREMVQRGIPRVVVDTGRILAKISFSTYQLDDDNAAASNTVAADALSGSDSRISNLSAASINTPLRNTITTRRLVRSNIASLSKIRMKVTPAQTHTASGEGERESSSIYGEVEINFRTVER